MYDFAVSLLNGMKDMSGESDINHALCAAHDLVRRFENGKLNELGNYCPHHQYLPMYHDINTGRRIFNSETYDAPNYRVILYTGSEQMAQYGALTSPFENVVKFDPLVGVYIGNRGTRAERELRSILHYCPIHGEQRFISVAEVQMFPTLLGLIRSSKGASGFCKKCIR